MRTNPSGLLLATLTACPGAILDSRDRPSEPTRAAPAGLGDVLTLGSQTSHPLVLADGAQDVYLYLSLRAAELERVPRLGLNLALVIDRSGSMASEDKLVFAKSAAEQIVGRLRPDDRLAIVAYDTEVQTVVPSTLASERSAFLAAIRALQPGNETNLCAGMERGYEEVARNLDETRLNRVVLLSDGLANQGVIDPIAIRQRAQACRDHGVRISTLGMGLAYDENLMSAIAQQAGGNYYYVDHAEAVGKHLDRELDELGRVVARDLVVRVALGESVELQDVFGYPWSMDGRTLVVPVEDMYSGERKKIVVRLRTSGSAGSERTIARAALRYHDAVAQTARALEDAPLRVRFTDSVSEVEGAKNLGVLTKVEIVRNARALEDAMALQKQGKFESAQDLLAARYKNSKTLNDTEYQSEELTRMLSRMRQVMLDLERTRADARARRDVELLTGLQALGYGGSD